MTVAELIISIHAARVGCDIAFMECRQPINDFNPRSPSGLRPGVYIFNRILTDISIHAARVGCDGDTLDGICIRLAISIHAARVGCDLHRL